MPVKISASATFAPSTCLKTPDIPSESNQR